MGVAPFNKVEKQEIKKYIPLFVGNTGILCLVEDGFTVDTSSLLTVGVTSLLITKVDGIRTVSSATNATPPFFCFGTKFVNCNGVEVLLVAKDTRSTIACPFSVSPGGTTDSAFNCNNSSICFRIG